MTYPSTCLYMFFAQCGTNHGRGWKGYVCSLVSRRKSWRSLCALCVGSTDAMHVCAEHISEDM